MTLKDDDLFLTERGNTDYKVDASQLVPVGTEAERPSTPVEGMFRFNSTVSEFEGFDGTKWGSIGGAPTESPPVINSVTIAEDDPTGARFTDKDFTVSTTMVNEGTPLSQKGVKATVSAELDYYPTTGTVTNVATTIPSSFAFPGWASFYFGNRRGDDMLTCYAVNSSNVGSFFASITNGTYGFKLMSSPNGQTWTEVPNLGSGFAASDKLKQVGEYLVAKYGFTTLVDTPGAAVQLSNDVRDYAYDGTYYYYALKYGTTIKLYRGTTLYNASEISTIDSGINESPYMEYGNGRLMCVLMTGNPSYTCRVKVSTDQGITWSSATAPTPQFNCRDLKYINNTWFALQTDGLYRSTNNGSSWTQGAAPPNNGSFSGIDYDGQYLYASYNYTIPNPPSTGNRGGSGVLRSNNNGTSWTSMSTTYPGGTASSDRTYAGAITSCTVGNGRVVLGGYYNQRDSSFNDTYSRYTSVESAKQVLTLSSDSALTGPTALAAGDPVLVNGSGQVGMIQSINAATPSITMSWPPLVSNGQFIQSAVPKGAAVLSSKYLILDSSGNVSSISSLDPGFVNYGPGTSVKLKFPSTFPTGNAPDVELRAGTQLRAEIEAVNSVASDTELSNIVVPN